MIVYNFIEKCIRGLVKEDMIDDYVDRWHNSDSTLKLSEYLGMTECEYQLWVSNNSNLSCIVLSRILKIAEDIKLAMETLMMEKYIGECNDSVTRLEYENTILEYLVKLGVSQHCFIHCDETNNPPKVIDKNDMVCSVTYVISPGNRVEIRVSALEVMNDIAKRL